MGVGEEGPSNVVVDNAVTVTVNSTCTTVEVQACALRFQVSCACWPIPAHSEHCLFGWIVHCWPGTGVLAA